MVPVEILDYIFGLLDGDQSSLKACSKVNSSFSKIVERHLYAHIVIACDVQRSDDPHAFSCSQLSNILSENPQVVKYIRSLRLDMNRRSEGMIELTSILPMLPKLETMTIRPSNYYVPWPNLDELFQKTFIDCLLRSLKGLFLEYVKDFPLSILDKCDNLKKLSLHGLSPPAEQYSPCCGLEYLSIESFQHISSSFSNLRSLRSFVFRPFTHRGFDPLQKLFQASTSLTTLELFLNRFFSTDYNIHVEHSEMDRIPFTLSVLSCLEQLTIHAIMYLHPETDDGNQKLSSALPSIIHLVTTAPSLKQLIFHFSIGFFNKKSPASSMWSPLTTLARSSFKGRVFLYTNWRPTFDNLMLSFKADTELMRMIDEGRLVIISEDDS